MIRALLLGPGSLLDVPGHFALDTRRNLAGLLRDARQVAIMEDEPSPAAETDSDKFLRLLSEADEIIVWLPRNGRLPTVFSELVVIRFHALHRGKRIAIFYEEGVIDTSGGEWVCLDVGKIGYLRDLTKVADVWTWAYRDGAQLMRLVDDYGQGLLVDPPATKQA